MATKGSKMSLGIDGVLSRKQRRGGRDPREVGEDPQGREEGTWREERRGGSKQTELGRSVRLRLKQQQQ